MVRHTCNYSSGDGDLWSDTLAVAPQYMGNLWSGTLAITPQTFGFVAEPELSEQTYFATFCQIQNAREFWQTP